jgi:hypothetical protein
MDPKLKMDYKMDCSYKKNSRHKHRGQTLREQREDCIASQGEWLQERRAL